MSVRRSGGHAGERRFVALVGNPNVGKSTLFNRLTGARQRVVNAPGTTVEIERGRWERTGFDVVDLPGTYSLLARSADEEATADCLLGRAGQPAPALAVVVLDATSLSRSLYLLAQLAQVGVPLVVAVTFVDVARSRGEELDLSALAAELGVPVVALDPRSGAGTKELAEAVVAAATDPPRVRGLQPAPAGPDEESAPAGLLADADRLFAWVARTAEAAGAGASGESVPRAWSDRVDAVLLRPWAGVPVFLLALWVLFEVATRLAEPLMDAAAAAVEGPVTDATAWVLGLAGLGGGWLEGLLTGGVLAGAGAVAAFAPLMALVFLAVALLEDSGYLARAAVVADRGMRHLGLDGRALLPLVIGFGCNLPALAALKAVPGERQRRLLSLLVPYTSCSARLTVYILLASVFFPTHAGTVIFGMYVGSVALIVLVGLVARRTGFRDFQPEPLVLVLPPYQRPRLGALARSAMWRVAAFLKSAGRVIVVTTSLVWVLLAIPVARQHEFGDVPAQDSAFGAVAQAAAPVLAPAGFGDWHASAALITGVVAKEVVVASFVQTYGIEEAESPAPTADGSTPALSARLQETFDRASGGHGQAAALAFLVFVLAYTPCVATLAEQARMFGWRWAGGAAVLQVALAWTVAVAVFQIGRLL